jgi:hypothetical protein
MKMEIIKSLTIDAMEDLSLTLSVINTKIDIEKIRKNVADYLINNGSKKFVELYNDVAKDKNYKKAFTTLNL